MPSPLRIRFLKYAAGPDFGPFSPGDETELPYDRARVLLDAGEAERLGTVEPEQVKEPAPAEPPQVERAVLRQPETAVGPAQQDQRSAEPEPLEEDEDLLQDELAPEGAPVEEAPLEENPTAEADSDQDPNYQAGRQAAQEGQPRSANPNDGRTAPGRAWLRGYDAAGPDDVA